MRAVDRLIEARWIVPVRPAHVVLEHHAIAIHQGRIVAILPSSEANLAFDPASRVVLDRHVVLPGFVNLHAHAAMSLLRGVGDDLSLERWLSERIWPLERALMSYEFVYDGTRAACLEMIKSGTTCMNDMYFFPDAAAEAVLQTGMRACLGVTVIDFPTAWAADPDDYLNRGLAVRDRYVGERTIGFSIAPHAPYTVSDATFRRCVTLAEQLDLPVHVHLHETAEEVRDAVARTGRRPIARMNELGVIGPRTIAVHCVHLDAGEIALLARGDVAVAHCPTSNLKLGSGVAPVAALLTAGVRVGIGTDGAASNNRLDMLAELRLASLLAKGTTGRADAFAAFEAIEAATLAGATALGLEDRIGSIEVGKEADLVALEIAGIEAQPCFDPISHTVFVLAREHVSHVWIAGNPVVEMRQFSKARLRDAEFEGASAMSLWQNRILKEVGRNA